MKLAHSLVAAALAALVAVPAFSFAQSSQPVTRAEVKAELVQLQKAGYNRASDNTRSPANLLLPCACVATRLTRTLSRSSSRRIHAHQGALRAHTPKLARGQHAGNPDPHFRSSAHDPVQRAPVRRRYVRRGEQRFRI
ncbi:DUF4148 domain-containing protein [Paraburkholderia ferrariae]|uniref:DUF4148 domain-containing protein n=1 Tax=Paraburkholderia ferrariae TaxID=386056 RepID=A0ABU9RUP4_9BURK